MSRGIALLFNLCSRCGWVVNVTPRPLYPRERCPVPVLQEAGWDAGSVCTGAENLASAGIRSPGRPARGDSLCSLQECLGCSPVSQGVALPKHTGFFWPCVCQDAKVVHILLRNACTACSENIYPANCDWRILHKSCTLEWKRNSAKETSLASSYSLGGLTKCHVSYRQ